MFHHLVHALTTMQGVKTFMGMIASYTCVHDLNMDAHSTDSTYDNMAKYLNVPCTHHGNHGYCTQHYGYHAVTN